MNRVSVTTLEKFRRYMAGTSPYDTEESLIESLKGLFKGTDKTLYGSAYHKLIEGEYVAADKEVAVCIHQDVFVFTPEQYAPALAFRDKHLAMVFEQDQRKVYETAFGKIQVTGRIDGLKFMKAHDFKTCFRSVDDQSYRDSCQWKFYLNMLELSNFEYNVFEIQGFKELHGSPHKLDVKIVAHEPIVCNAYQGMEEELITLLNDFLSYINNRQFQSLLKPAIEDAKDIVF